MVPFLLKLEWKKCENYAACDKEITCKQRKQKIERLRKETDNHKVI